MKKLLFTLLFISANSFAMKSIDQVKMHIDSLVPGNCQVTVEAGTDSLYGYDVYTFKLLNRSTGAQESFTTATSYFSNYKAKRKSYVLLENSKLVLRAAATQSTTSALYDYDTLSVISGKGGKIKSIKYRDTKESRTFLGPSESTIRSFKCKEN